MEMSSRISRGRPSNFKEVILGKDPLPQATSYRDEDAERAAAYARLIAVLATTFYVLGTGLLFAPRPVRLLSANLLVFVVLVLIMEAGSKILHIHFPGITRRDADYRNLWVYDRTKGWFHFPNGSGQTYLGGPDRGIVRLNSLGLRGKEVALVKPQEVQRVLVVGDSYVFGLGVDEEHSFTTHLERFLDTALGDARQIEVINMGVTGYSTDQQYILFQEIGMKLFPDVVVLVACDNDFVGNRENFAWRRYYKPFFELDEGGALVLRNTPVPLLTRTQRVKLFLGQESNVWNFFRSRATEVPLVVDFVNFFQIDVPVYTAVDPVDITAALILGFSERVGSTGARFLVTNTAHRGEETTLFQALRPKLRKPGIHLLGLEEVLGDARRDQPDKLWDFGEDYHWNVDAHRLAAQVISNYILWNGLLGNPGEEGGR
jgi:hypothetical protein